jgi:hypothetical protein
MQSKTASWRWTIWIACFAVLMNALAPSISHAMAVRGNAPATWEICRADGTISMEAELFAAQLSNKIADHQAGMMQDCGYCLPHGGSVGLVAATVTGLGLMGGHALRPFLFYHAPQPLLALSAAPPRGPPAFA